MELVTEQEFNEGIRKISVNDLKIIVQSIKILCCYQFIYRMFTKLYLLKKYVELELIIREK